MESTSWNVLIKFIHTLKLFNSNPYTLYIFFPCCHYQTSCILCTCRPAQPTGNKINICYEFDKCADTCVTC